MSGTFDTSAAARQLQAAGMERPHAEAVADAVRDSREGLATEAALETGLEAVRRELATHRWVLSLNTAMVMAILVVMLTRSFSL